MRGIRQQHENAQTGRVRGEGDRFGVAPLSAVNAGGPSMGSAMTPKVLSDEDRGIGRPVRRGRGEMPAQAHPDHGPHHHHD